MACVDELKDAAGKAAVGAPPPTCTLMLKELELLEWTTLAPRPPALLLLLLLLLLLMLTLVVLVDATAPLP